MHKFEVISTLALFMLVSAGAASAASQGLTKDPGSRPSPRPGNTTINCIQAPCEAQNKPRPRDPVIVCIKAPCEQPGRPRPGNDTATPRPNRGDANCGPRGCFK